MQNILNKAVALSNNVRKCILNSKTGEPRGVFLVPNKDGYSLRTIVKSSPKYQENINAHPETFIGTYDINSLPAAIVDDLREHCNNRIQMTC